MNPGAVVFALANPDPEIDPLEAQPHAAVVATGRSDFPNQINNVLAFPGVFRGLLDAQATEITDEMLIAAAEAIAERGVAGPAERVLHRAERVRRERQQGGARAVVEAAQRRGPGSAAAPRSRCCHDRCPVSPITRGPCRIQRPALTHVDASGAARMVDVSGKDADHQDGARHRGAAHHRRGGARCCSRAVCRRATRWPPPGSPASWRPNAPRTWSRCATRSRSPG